MSRKKKKKKKRRIRQRRDLQRHQLEDVDERLANVLKPEGGQQNRLITNMMEYLEDDYYPQKRRIRQKRDLERHQLEDVDDRLANVLKPEGGQQNRLITNMMEYLEDDYYPQKRRIRHKRDLQGHQLEDVDEKIANVLKPEGGQQNRLITNMIKLVE
uniref:Uncharacterized protein n=1 Tax=Cacopsylla melanoneura TaxID=428564 RepID=A0A8D9BYE5_9HEMI